MTDGARAPVPIGTKLGGLHGEGWRSGMRPDGRGAESATPPTTELEEEEEERERDYRRCCCYPT